MEWTIMKFLFGAVAVILAGSGIMFWVLKNSGPDHGTDKDSPYEESDDYRPPQERVFNVYALQESKFGIDRGKEGLDAKPVAFAGERAMGYLKEICDLGPRMSGSKAMKKQQDLIKKHFEDLGAKVQFQTFMAKQNSVRGEVEMTNIIVSFQPEKKRRVILCSHYDTRPIADREDDPRDWKKPFVSANDGGSGVALLMELGNHMKNLKTQVGVDFVIFDGEEYVFVTEGGNRDRYFIGSRYFAQSWRKKAKDKDRCDYSAAILLDMIAGKNIQFPVEVHSYNFAEELCKEIWGIAAEQKVKAFEWRRGHNVLDDHTELHKVGIPAIDIIDFDYPHWHRLSDTPANCSGDNMALVAKVLSVWLQRTK
jgi:glutaminyl-peptide cyclotransferase